jgi:hypothetical protein
LAEAIDVERLAEIRSYPQQQKAPETMRFQTEIEAALGRSMMVKSAPFAPILRLISFALGTAVLNPLRDSLNKCASDFASFNA